MSGFITTFLALFFRFFKCISMLYNFVHRPLNPLKAFGLSTAERPHLNMLRHMTNSCWVNFCVHSKVSPLHRIMKSFRRGSRLWVLQNCLMTSCSFACWLTMDPSERFAFNMKAALSRAYTKRCNNSASHTVGWPSVWGQIFRAIEHLEFWLSEVLKFDFIHTGYNLVTVMIRCFSLIYYHTCQLTISMI